MNETELSRQLELLPGYLGNHLLLSLVALSAGILICLPVAIVVTRVKPLQWPVLTFAGIMQTVPGIALLALMVPLLGTIGFLPACIALVLYSMLPILRNTVTGILGVDASLTEAARGIGMTDTQQLLKVELPLALPVIIAGIRTSAVWVVGTATLSTPVGATSLGNYIFGGLQTQNFTAVMVGCVAAAGLAIILDQVIHLLEIASTRRSRPLAFSAAAGMAILIAGGMAPWLAKSSGTDQQHAVVGAKTFTEQYILADLLATQLREAGFAVTTKPGLGSTIVFDALEENSIDCYVDYSGTIWANIMKRQDVPPRAEILRQMAVWLKDHHGITLLGPLGFQNTYALALPREKALAMDIHSMEDLARRAPRLSIGSDYEFFTRPEWRALKQAYNLRFAGERTFDPSLMYPAVHNGLVDVISAYSTDGRIAEYDLLVLSDPKQALPPYDAVLLISPRASRNPLLTEVLMPLIGSIPDDLMRRANKMVDVDKMPVENSAAFLRTFLRQRSLESE